MAVTVKNVDITNTEFRSEQEYAEHTTGVYMNMLNGVSYNEVDGKYHMLPIKYSDADLTGEKIKFASGQEFTVIFSCLAKEYANKAEVKEKWWNAARNLVESYKKEMQIEDHIRTHNTDLKKLRAEGTLKDQDELDNE